MRVPALACLSLAALAACGPARAEEARPLLASAPVDASVFRDGEVRRSTEPFGRWTLVCDTIARLGHKFCSLRSAPAQLGSTAIDLLVSTGDDGRPAALVRLPFGMSLPFGLQVEPLGHGRTASHRVAVAVCGAGGCEAVWTLSPTEIAALRTGEGLQITVHRGHVQIDDHAAPAPMTATIAATGFAEAITASLK